MMRLGRGVRNALAAAVLFGASTPLAKLLLDEVSPVLLAGMLYAGSGVGLVIWLFLRHLTTAARFGAIAWPRGRDVGWLAGATFFGGVLGPILLMLALASTTASAAALLLNVEAVFTACLAWFAFRENFDHRIALGMALIVIGGFALAWAPGDVALSPGALLVVMACAAWAIDNNLTRKVSGSDATVIACVKGLAAGAVNIGIAATIGATMPSLPVIAAASVVGLAGYGISLTLFVLALRDLGTARTGAYFSVAPFFGAVFAIVLTGEAVTWQLLFAWVTMAIGVWLHVSERHWHLHAHGDDEHIHSHIHDEHHRHSHDFPWDGSEPHTHAHTHSPLVHAHEHYPDFHHRHGH